MSSVINVTKTSHGSKNRLAFEISSLTSDVTFSLAVRCLSWLRVQRLWLAALLVWPPLRPAGSERNGLLCPHGPVDENSIECV